MCVGLTTCKLRLSFTVKLVLGPERILTIFRDDTSILSYLVKIRKLFNLKYKIP